MIDTGRANLEKRLNDLSKSNRCIVLIGYSTGVPIIEKTLSGLDSQVGDHIVAVELFADPVLALQPKDRQLHVPAAYTNRVRYECNVADAFCSVPLGLVTAPRETFGAACAEEILRQTQAGEIKPIDLGGPCLLPKHLPPAYAAKAQQAALWAIGGITGAARNQTVSPGDTLWDLAERVYGQASMWRRIYDASRALIEAVARQHGFTSSDGGHWIFPGTNLVIPSGGDRHPRSTRTSAKSSCLRP